MKIIGITGNFGSGKSSIAGLFKKYNCRIIILDELGHRILQKPVFKKRLVQQFGKYILENNVISREKLRKIVFYNPEYLLKLNKIIHPELIKSLKNEIKKEKNTGCRAVVIDAALIFELNIRDMMDIIITVATNKLISFFRILKNKKIFYREFSNIYNSQLPLKEKIKRSDHVIYNNLPLKYNYKKINGFIKKILNYE